MSIEIGKLAEAELIDLDHGIAEQVRFLHQMHAHAMPANPGLNFTSRELIDVLSSDHFAYMSSNTHLLLCDVRWRV